MADKRLGVGFVGGGFNARFHLQAFQAVRDADVLGVWSPTGNHAEETAALARKLDLEEIADAVTRGLGRLKGIACEKPLARNVAEAMRVVELARQAGVAHGYLENQ